MVNADLQAVALEIEQADTGDILGKYLTFLTDGQTYGISVAHVAQIVKVQEITSIPEFPPYAKGIINLRGAIIPLIDMRLYLGRQEAAYTDHTCTIITDVNAKSVGFIVDEVDAVITIAENFISPPPTFANHENNCIVGVAKLEDKVVLLMDTCKILGAENLNFLTN